MAHSDQGVSGIQPPQGFQQIPVGPRRTRSGRYRAVQVGGTEAPVVETFNEHAYARLNGSFNVNPPFAGASLVCLTSTGVPRNMLMLRNASASGGPDVLVNFGTDAGLSSILRLTPGTHVLFDVVVPQDDVYCFASGAGATLVLAVSTVPFGVMT